jgi:hypothetical protein
MPLTHLADFPVNSPLFAAAPMTIALDIQAVSKRFGALMTVLP